MVNKIKSVIALNGYRLHILFQDGLLKELDMNPFIEKYECFSVFKNNQEFFNNVYVALGGYGIFWNDDIVLDIKDIEKEGKIIDPKTDFYNVSTALIDYIVAYRRKHNLTQLDVSNISGVAQPCIARIESKKTDPQLSTFVKIVNSLGLKVGFEDNNMVDFAVAVNKTDGVEPTHKEKIILNLLAQDIIDYESAMFIMKRIYQNV